MYILWVEALESEHKIHPTVGQGLERTINILGIIPAFEKPTV